ncbi:hypothetical protein BCR42DRAFT_429567 [Absidia repens]|uniref:Uncharacterized protein n=1 Tax=Absidia repens TaxID=90262 RepID=A0A1X2HYA7_9FUNG|nr:hypothetical protein BCR42DRAFT_430578 [Absidia repens]ORZ04147.1 hypothetical protein BCR42DRAFT_429567 [Absidia repens]
MTSRRMLKRYATFNLVFIKVGIISRTITHCVYYFYIFRISLRCLFLRLSFL